MNRFLTAAFAALAVIALSTVAHAQAGWRTHSYPELGLTIDLPGEPVKSRSTGGGAGETVIAVNLGPAGAMMLRVMDTATPGLDPDAMLEAGVQGGIAAVQAEVLANEKITYRGWPARDVTLRSPSRGMTARIRLVMVDGRLHQLLIGYPLDGQPPEGSLRFLDSLNVVAKGQV